MSHLDCVSAPPVVGLRRRRSSARLAVDSLTRCHEVVSLEVHVTWLRA